jgi:exosortase/archaeosortase family protein
MNYRLLLVLTVISQWPVWVWYGKRMTDGSDEPWGILALISVLIFVPWNRVKDTVPTPIVWSVVLSQVLFHSAVIDWVPLLQALVVVVTLAVIVVSMRAPMGVLGLLCLSLPWIATLQFYLGYPLRVFVGSITVGMLSVCGLDVTREGVALLCDGKMVVVDRPCAGIYMLWFGAFLTYLLACFYRLRLAQCLQLGLFSFVIIMLTNILRNFVLFFIETQRIDVPGYAHEGVGVFLFLTAILALVKIMETIVSGCALRSVD